MNFKDKNNIVLAISAGLIVLAIIIALIASGVEKKKTEGDSSSDTTSSSSVSTTAAATTDVKSTNTPGKYKVVTENDSLTLRNEPNNKSQTVNSLKKGTVVTVSATYGEWAFIEIDGTYGWANLNFLELTEKGEAPKHATGKYIINTQETPLGIRNMPNGVRGDKEIAKGVEVEILTVSGEWGYVEHEGLCGWLSFEYLKAK